MPEFQLLCHPPGKVGPSFLSGLQLLSEKDVGITLKSKIPSNFLSSL